MKKLYLMTLIALAFAATNINCMKSGKVKNLNDNEITSLFKDILSPKNIKLISRNKLLDFIAKCEKIVEKKEKQQQVKQDLLTRIDFLLSLED